ncbi:DNA-directed RNA polymerase subunit beta [Dirofilaria immitis]
MVLQNLIAALPPYLNRLKSTEWSKRCSTTCNIMYLPTNSTIIPSVESDRVSRMYSDLYILFAFMGFIVGSFVLFFTINVSKARLEARNNTTVYVIDLPPRYSEVEPPSYDWVLKHCYLEDYAFKVHMTLNLSTMIVIYSCLVLL